ncbi:hypothetical protein NST63_27720 [Heyndrickxia sp. FSL W8-0496]|uniref:hypothetical protein n=1 Tax=Heyndrickxia sp. FSL W8-0496 TaxID=2954702 RepID=UPI0030F60998
MLKTKVKSIQRQLNKISKFNMDHVFIVDVEDGNYIVKLHGKVVCEGNEQVFNAFGQQYKGTGSVFIISDIPRQPEHV